MMPALCAESPELLALHERREGLVRRRAEVRQQIYRERARGTKNRRYHEVLKHQNAAARAAAFRTLAEVLAGSPELLAARERREALQVERRALGAVIKRAKSAQYRRAADLETRRRWRRTTPEKRHEYLTAYSERHREAIRDRAKAVRDELPDRYVRKVLTEAFAKAIGGTYAEAARVMRAGAATQELVEAKRLQMRATRAIRKAAK